MRNEKVIYISSSRSVEAIMGCLRDDGLDMAPYLARGQLSVVSAYDALPGRGALAQIERSSG
jgi:hypothetical protein